MNFYNPKKKRKKLYLLFIEKKFIRKYLNIIFFLFYQHLNILRFFILEKSLI